MVLQFPTAPTPERVGESAAPSFTVVMPTYNRAGVLLDAVSSVLAQTYKDFEFIIVDDHSTDSTRSVLTSITDSRVTVVTNQRTKGTAGARNTGILMARGVWVCQIDSDDLWPPDMLELFADVIGGLSQDVGVVFGSLCHLDTRTGQIVSVRRAEQSGRIQNLLLENHFMHHCAAAIRTTALREIGGYDESFWRQSDSDLLIRLAGRYSAFPVPEAVYTQRMGGGDQLMSEKKVGLTGLEQLFAKHAVLLARHPRARYQQLSNILMACIAERRWRRALRTWSRMVPCAWAAPRVFADTHIRISRLAAQRSRVLGKARSRPSVPLDNRLLRGNAERHIAPAYRHQGKDQPVNAMEQTTLPLAAPEGRAKSPAGELGLAESEKSSRSACEAENAAE